jgi:nitrogen fixation protein NifU and related proteins
MTDLDALYQALILDHNRRPRNWGEPAGADRRQEGHNPLCGDRLTVWLRLDGDTIADVGFVGAGCAISKASASLMTTVVKGRSRAEAESLFERFHDLVTGRADAAGREALGRLAAFGGVARFPARVKCASLSWHTMMAALRQGAAPVSTE